MLDEPKTTTTTIALSSFSYLLVPSKQNAAYLKENTPFIKALGKGLTEKLQRSIEKTEDGYFIKEEQALKKRSIDSF